MSVGRGHAERKYMIRMEVNQTEFSNIMNALDRVKIGTGALLTGTLDRLSRDMSITLKSNIYSQRYGDFGKPHSPEYARYKADVSPYGDAYWLDTSDLAESITFWSTGMFRFHSGIPVGVDNQSGRPISLYGQVLERGSRAGHKPRPLFQKSLDDFMLEKVPEYMIQFYSAVLGLWH